MQRLPKVLIVAPRLDIGGTEMHLVRIVPPLRNTGIDVSLYAMERGGALEADVVAAGVPVFGRVSKRSWLNLIVSLVDLTRHIYLTKPDILHFFLPRPYLVGSLAAMLVRHKRRIMSRRSLVNYKRGHPLLIQVERLVHRLTLSLLANSSAVANQLLDETKDPKKIGLIHNGIQVRLPRTPDSMAAARAMLNIDTNTFVIAVVANVVGYKGHADLLAALARIRNAIPRPWRLLVIGRDGGIGQALTKQAAVDGIAENILWLGERHDVAQLLDAVDVAVLPSHQEGFSNSLLETLSRGIPTIATAVGGNIDAIVDNVSGLLVPIRAPEHLANALERLCGDPELRKRLGNAGRARVEENFSLEACIRKYKNLYRNHELIGKLPTQALIDSVVGPNEVTAPAVMEYRLGSAPRIAYSPHTASMEAPGDRRRFVAYAKERNLSFEIARLDERYDLVVLSESADISAWPDYPHGKLVYDLIDSYLSVPRSNIAQLLRGTAWYALNKHKKLRPDYLGSIRAMCLRSDAVICSTKEQESIIRDLCSNVHVILDVHAMVVRNIKRKYSANDPFRLVWEGLPSNLPQLSEVAPIIRDLQKSNNVELHVVTDPARELLKGMLGEADTQAFLARHFSNSVFHEWHESTCAQIISGCDLAIIPIDLDDSFVRGKPENKLLLLWRMGLPAVVSATPAYARAMADVGTPELACANDEQWLSALHRMMRNEDLRHAAAIKGQFHAATAHSTKAVLARWDALFASVGFSFGDRPAVH
jgi:glycosyltransferase involved in cell wall biosynthesis